jgi:Flp pilus assembly protein TadD
MRGLIILTIGMLLGLSACTSQGDRLDPVINQGLDAPDGTAVLRDAVDPLLVGHRLMEAGEYELALRAYYRAGVDHGTTVDVLTALGSANLRLGRIGQAETLLRQATTLEPDYPAAWNNLGVALMEQGEFGEARQVFRHAYALDSGQSDSIRDNLRMAIAQTENSVYGDGNNEGSFDLVRRGGGRYILLATP